MSDIDDPPSLVAALRTAGVADTDALVARLSASWPGGAPPTPVLAAFARAPDPALAVASLIRLRDALPEAVEAAAADATRGAALVALLGASNMMVRLLIAEPMHWPALLGAEEARTSIPAVEPRPEPPMAASPEELAHLLRVFKRRRVLLIAARDLLGRSTLTETMTELSRLAEDALEVAVAAVRARLVAAHGDVVVDGVPLGFSVLGMGKLGGGELNFSSDIDLVYVYADGGTESTGGPRGTLSAREFMSRLAEGVTRALHQATDEGFVFRVDLRLRPEGTNGPIVNSLANALLYYESWGQTWERAAYLKARPVAGDRALGEALLRDLEPFVYRRYLDYATLEDLKQMKARVKRTLAASPDKGMNVKLGRGGIREVEFVIQSLQLIHAGKDERIRERNSLAALARFVETRYLSADESRRLADAYRFLRDVEHKIQLVDERQTQVIPSGEGEVQLARRLGYRDLDPAAALARFQADRRRHMDAVATSFADLFYGSQATMAEADDGRYARLLAGLDDDAEKAEAGLAALGFRDPRSARDDLVLLRDGPPSSRATPRRKQLLLAVVPALLGEVARAPDPDLALRHLAGFMGAIGARSSFLALLAENPATLRVLVRLFGSSDFLSQILIRHPEMLDSLVRADLVRLEVPKTDLAAELTSLIDGTESYESRLDALRRFRHEQFLRIGINDLDNLLPFHVASSQLSDLADVCLDAAWRVAEEETRRRYGVEVVPGRFAVVGLGKLGAREITYNSDLDLIFVYVPTAAETGPVSVHEFFTTLAQTLMTTLQVQTREGRMYSIDTRLRPSGNQGPLVSSLESFARYHAESAQLWERQAMIKARGVAGEPALRSEVETIIDRFVYAQPLRDDEVAEIHRLRMRLEHELAGDERAEFNIKAGRGGLLDIEFMVQMKQLRHGTDLPAIRRRATRHALMALAAAGVVPPEQADTIEQSYAFLRVLTNRLRIERDQPVESLEREGDRLPALARRLGYTGSNEAVARQLLDDYGGHRERVRALYVTWFGVES
jgi:glutamate-ammonia-ligase adenylyltransferase